MSTPNFCVSVPSRPVGSLAQIFSAVKIQVEYSSFDSYDKALASELCLIIAEMFTLPPDAEVQIGKDKPTAETVQQVYFYLTHEHLKLVMDNFRSCSREIKFKKAYLRTALYTSVFEYESHYANLYAAHHSKAVCK